MSENARPFVDFLREQRRGDFMEDCTKALHELVTQVSLLGKGGKMVIEIEVKPVGARDQTGSAVTVSDRVETKLPKNDPIPTVFFVTKEHNLSRTDPMQSKLELRDVDSGEARPLKEAK